MSRWPGATGRRTPLLPGENITSKQSQFFQPTCSLSKSSLFDAQAPHIEGSLALANPSSWQVLVCVFHILKEKVYSGLVCAKSHLPILLIKISRQEFNICVKF